MAAISSGAMQTAFNVSGTTDPMLTPAFETGDTCYIRSELDTPGQKTLTQDAYTVVDIAFKSNGGAVTGADGTTPADGSAADSVSTDGSTPDTDPLHPFFFNIKNVAQPTKTTKIHETGLLDLTGINFVRDDAANDWT